MLKKLMMMDIMLLELMDHCGPSPMVAAATATCSCFSCLAREAVRGRQGMDVQGWTLAS